MIQMVDKPNTTQDGETLTFKALPYLNVAVHGQVCRLFCVVYIPLLSFVQLGSAWLPRHNEYFVANQIFRYNGAFAINGEDPATTNIFFGTMTLRYSGVPLHHNSMFIIGSADNEKLGLQFQSRLKPKRAIKLL